MSDLRTKSSPYFAKKHHTKLRKFQTTKEYVFTDGFGEAYSQNRVSTTDFVGGNTGKSHQLFGKLVEWSVWFNPSSTGNNRGIFGFGNRLFVWRLFNDSHRFRLYDEDGTELLHVSSNQQSGVGSWHHLYGWFDNREAGSGSYGMLLNGTAGTYNEITGPTYTGKNIETRRAYDVLRVPIAPAFTFDGSIADLYVNVTNEDRQGYNAFVDGSGNPKDPRNLPTNPLIMLGSVMTADDWNAGKQLGQLGYTKLAGSVSPV